VRVHRTREHALELEPLELARDTLDLTDQIRERRRVALLARELVQLGGFLERLADAPERADDGLERCALAS
jgi:hypothetical protein